MLRGAVAVVGVAAILLPTWATAAPHIDPGCQRAAAHTAGAATTHAGTAMLCTGVTDQFSAEPTVGILADRTVVQYPAYQQHPVTSYTRSALAVSTKRFSTAPDWAIQPPELNCGG